MAGLGKARLGAVRSGRAGKAWLGLVRPGGA